MLVSPVADHGRQKRSHPKVRTGCSTCKIRRVKCDESRPVCNRCAQGNRQCHYSVPKTWLFEANKEVSPLKPPPSIASGSPEEQRSFEFFRCNTAAQFGGHHELSQKFWNHFVPRAAKNESLLYKLAVAMGAQHEATAYGSFTSAELATKNHALVISTMARSLPQMKIETSLLCCAMLMGYSNLCEEVPATAAIHFSLGLKMLREQAQPGKQIMSDSMGAFIEPMFAELELATVLFAIPPSDVEIICPRALQKPMVPQSFTDLYHAKQTLVEIISWLMYASIIHRESPTEIAARNNEVDELVFQWRRKLVEYSLMIAASHPGLYMKSRKMLFQYKLFGMCKGAARNSVFTDACRIRVLSVDFTEPRITSILCTLKRHDGVDDRWRPLAHKPSRREDEDDLDIWPKGEPVGHDGPNQIVRIVLGT